jgi:hypothetical protein
MASSTLKDSPAVVILSAPNPGGPKITISEEIKRLGLNHLRTSVSALYKVALPDVIQPGYSTFKSCLPYFCAKSVYPDRFVNTLTEDLYVSWKDVTLPPFKPMPLIMAFSRGEAPREVIEEMRGKLNINETVSGGKPAIEFIPANWTDYEQVKKYNPVRTAVCNYEQVNPKALNALRRTLGILTAVVHATRYPAFTDVEHMNNLEDIALWRKNEAGMEIDNDDGSKSSAAENVIGCEVTAPGEFKDIEVENIPYYSFNRSYNNLPDAETYIELDEFTPPGDGLWFPYFSEVAAYDEKEVPRFLESYVGLNFGSTRAEALGFLRDSVSEWATAGRSETGKQISHMTAVLRLAVEGQGRALPAFRRGLYAGVVLLGQGFTVQVGDRMYRPVGSDALLDAIQSSDSHQIALIAISSLMGNKVQKDDIMTSTSLLDLSNKLQRHWTKAGDLSVILNHAKYLDFRFKSWPANLGKISFALSKIKDMSFNIHIEDGSDFPIHWSKIFETDTASLVWSCFGSVAPSFRVPGGKEFSLKEDMEVESSTPRGDKRVIRMVRIACRMKSLDEAISDLRMMSQKQTIMNPLVMQRVRASQKNMDKMFTKEAGKELLGVLREFCGISASGASKKRKVGDGVDFEEGPSSKRRARDDEF